MPMRMLPAAALAAGVALISTDSIAAEFDLVEVPAIAEIPIAQLKPQSIVFSDQPGGDVDPAVGFIRYEDWANVRPVHRQFLSLYPGYSEPNLDILIEGAKRRYREKLHMYVAEARFVIGRAPAAQEVARLATLPFIERMDPAIKHRLVTAQDIAARPREPKVISNQNPQRQWCEGRPTVICLRSTYRLEGRLPVGIALANKIRESAKRISDTLEFDSEVTVLSAAEIDERGLKSLTRLETPAVGALEQSIFYVNQAMQFGKLLAVFQAHPDDPKKTVVSVFTALATQTSLLSKQKQYAKVPVLRNLVPAQVLLGKSSFNSGKSLSAGLPVYARNQTKAIAGLLEADGGKAAAAPAANPVR